MKKFLALAFLALSAISTAQATTEYFIDPTGNDSTGAGTSVSPWKTLDKAWTVTVAGDTVTLKDGVYNYAGMEFDTGMDKGSSWSAPITIRALNHFKSTVTLSGALNMGCDDGSATNWYTITKGIVFDYNSTKQVCGNYWKFQYCAFMGGGTSVYNENLSVGTNNYGSNPGATYGLVEDSFFVGDGGRYQMMIFNSRYIIGRRLVGWMDDTYNDSQGNPAAVFNIYNSEYSWFQNVVAMDVQELADFFQAGLYFTANTNGIPVSGNFSGYDGSMAVNIKEYGMRFDGALNITSATVRNCAFIDTTDGITLGGGSQSRTMTLRNVSIISVSTLTTGNEMAGIAEYDAGGTKQIINSIIANWPNDSISGSITGTYIDCYNNGGTCDGGTGQTTVNPRTSGMKYFTRIEAGSVLKTAGSGGGQIGPEIQYQIGATGSLYGDSGWDTLQATSLWPWTNEAAIKERFCSHYNSYGWCSSTYRGYSLTEYLNGYGNSPSYSGVDVSSPGAPTNLSTTSVTTSSFDYSVTAATDAAGSSGISGYFLDVSLASNFSSFVGSYQNYSLGNNITGTVSSLSQSTTYYWRMYAKDVSLNQGPYSASQSAVTATLDVTSPTAPGAPLASSTGTTSFNWTWTAATDAVGVTGYKFTLDDDSGFGSPVSGYNDLDVGNVLTKDTINLTPGVIYYTRVRAYDAQGNVGSYSTSGTGTTAFTPAPPRGNTLGTGRYRNFPKNGWMRIPK